MDSLILGLRVVVALGAVLGLMWFLQRRLGKGTGRRRAESALTVVSRQSLGQRASVVVVDAAGQRFLLGVTDHAVNVLHTGDIPPEPEEAREPAASRSLGDFARMLAEATPRPAQYSRTAQGSRSAQGSRAARNSHAFDSYDKNDYVPDQNDYVPAQDVDAGYAPERAAEEAGNIPADALVSRRSSAQRSAHARSAAGPGPGHPPLHGSILAGSTWKQAAAALRSGRRN